MPMKVKALLDKIDWVHWMRKKVFFALLDCVKALADHAAHNTRVVVVDTHQRGPNWHGPAVKQRITVGSRVDNRFIARHDVVKKPARYHLARTGANARWLKVRDDAVMVNLRTGRVLDVAYNLFR